MPTDAKSLDAHLYASQFGCFIRFCLMKRCTNTRFRAPILSASLAHSFATLMIESVNTDFNQLPEPLIWKTVLSISLLVGGWCCSVTRLVFYSGVNEIGGNKILLQDYGAKLVLGFGLSYRTRKRYYGEYLGPRGFAISDEYVSFGFLPAIKGAYREDHLTHIFRENTVAKSKSSGSGDAIASAFEGLLKRTATDSTVTRVFIPLTTATSDTHD